MDPVHQDDQPHVPPPSLWPIGFAVGIVLILVGLVVNPVLVIPIGVIVTLIFATLWIRDATAEHRQAAEHPAADEAAPVAPPAEAAPPEAEPPTEERYGRNVFLAGATLGLGALIGGLVTLPAIGFAVLPAFQDEESKDVDLGPLENFPENQFVIATFVTDPVAGPVSERTAFVRYNGTLNDQPSFTIISNRCVHLGCPTQLAAVPSPDDATEIQDDGAVQAVLIPTVGGSGYNCPCHGGAYDPEGNRTAGPPVRALDRYNFEIRDGRLILLAPYSVSEVEGTGAEARIHRYQLAGPGIHVDGPEAWLYPFESGDFYY